MKQLNKGLVIVESPSKIKTLKKFLGKEYAIGASVGHIRDLAKNNLGVDIDNQFKTNYIVSEDKKKVVSNLKSKLKSASELYLATDPDREGEAISWHIIEELSPKIPVKRLVFHEITKSAILNAFNNTREIDTSLVNAQEVDFVEYDLDNGLHVILHQDNRAPVITTSVLYHVGSKDEEEGRTGFAHMFEHLLFEGTENIEGVIEILSLICIW